MKLRIFLAATVMTVIATGAANATLVGTNVTGSLTFNSGITNYFDPANGFVPVGPENKTLGTTVPVSLSAVEFGFDDGANHDTANFFSTVLNINDVSSSQGGSSSRYQFTDPGFTTLSLISTNFTGALAYTIAGSTITIDFGSFTGEHNFTSSFRVQSETVPEPLTLSIFAAGLAGMAAVLRRKRAHNVRSDQTA